jgi:hypothetical protein
MGWMDEYRKALKRKAQEEEQTITSRGTSPMNSSFMDDYYRELNRMMAEDNSSATVRLGSEDVSVLGSTMKKEEEPWYRRGHFEDGYDFGDVTRTILGIKDKELKTFEDPVPDMSLEDLKAKRDSASDEGDQLEYTKQYNQKMLAHYSDVFAKTQMDGQNHSVLEEIEILAKMKSGKEKDRRKKAVLLKMEQLGMDDSYYAHFAGDGDFDFATFGKWIQNSMGAGLNSFNKSLFDTADVLLGSPMKALGWENNPISKGAEYYSDLYDSYRYNADLYAEKMGAGWNYATDATEGTFGALPSALMAIATGGASLGGTTTSLTQQAAYRASSILGKVGMTAEAMMKNPQYWLSFGRTFGSDYKEAKDLGASDLAASIGSTLKSMVNAGIEIGFDGASGIQGLPQSIMDGGKPFWEWVESSLEEGGEEVLQKFVGEMVNKFGYGSDEEILNPIEYAKEGSLGVISGMALGGGQVGVEKTVEAVNEHQANKLTDMEKSVKDKIVEKRIAQKEKDGKTLTAKEKADIEKEVDRNLRKGYLTAEEIEDAIGGEAYESFKAEQSKFFTSDEYKKYSQTKKDSEKRIAKMEKQLEEIGNQPNTVANAKKYESLQHRIDTLKKRTQAMHDGLLPEAERIMGIKNQMRTQMMETVKDSRLAEAYRELGRKKQKFAVDVNQYTNENAKKTVQSILDSGLGDNSNQFHETVEWLAKLSEERNVTFDLTKTERLKGTKHYREGYVTNGFKTKNGNLTNITINLDGNYLNTTVGHEITHVLEEAGVYKELSKAVHQFAISKEGQEAYNARLTAIKEIYGDDQATIDSEITADIIGEYLFTDYDFVHSLSTQNRNVFQKVYDEVKYMVKIATAGSNEARELLKVKKMFDKAWRENAQNVDTDEDSSDVDTDSATVDPENDSDLDYESPTKYSITVKDPDTIDFLENQEHITTYKAMVLIDGKLYPPMASKVKGEDGKYHMTNGRDIGEWMQAEEDTTNIKFNDKGIGYYDLKKDDGGTVRAAYNPYEHSSNLVLNDQFEAAYKRGNLVTVECVIPKSEVDNPYRAEYAKDSTGVMDWHSGVVAGKLSDNKRSVYLSRYLKVNRIVPDSEVAQKYKEIVGDLPVPFNVVSPGLLTELENVGVNIDYNGSPQYQYLQRRAAEKEAKKTQYSYSSIANSFFGNEKMTTAEFLEDDYHDTEGYQEYVEQCLNNLRQSQPGIDEDLARVQIQNSVDGIVRVAVAAKKAGYDIEDSAEMRTKRDSKKRLLFSSLEPNSDYFTSHDISTICDKRKNFAEIYDEIVRIEESKKVPKGKRFFDNVDNYFAIHDIMAKQGLTTPCRQCYVESMRKNLAPMAKAFLDLVQETDPNNLSNPQLWAKAGKDATDFVVGADGKKYAQKASNTTKRENVLQAFEEHPEYNMTANDLTIEMLTTAEGLAQLRLQAPLVYEAFNSFYGQAKPKMPKQATPFRFGELTALLTDDKGKINQKLVEKINSTGGFRLQSYSDFQIQNYVDVLQVLFEAGTLGLNGHAYTKVPAFLDATEGTNLKRNISIFMYKDGDQWKLDRNDSFPYSLEEIYDIVNNDKTGNTSIIAVSQNADMSAWIMANDFVGYGIPFHKSGLKMGTVRDTIVREGGREIKGYKGTIDHTKQQTEVWKNTTADHKALTKVKSGINMYSFWDFANKENLSKQELIEKNVKAYIDECDRLGYLPKFRAYVMNNGKVLNDVLKYSKELGFVYQDATIEDISFQYKGYTIPYGYYKFLGDFGMFTPDGMAAPQQTLSMENYDFDKAEQFFANAETLRRTEILQQYANGKVRNELAQSDMTTEELEAMAKQRRTAVAHEALGIEEDIAPTQYSMTKAEKTKMDEDYFTAVESGDEEVQKHLVREYAKASMPDSKLVDENGDLRVVYHGTNTGDFTVFNPDYIGMSSGDDGFFGMGFYFAYSKGEASYYGAKRIIPAYLNLTNPFNFQSELHTYNGKRARYGHAPDAVALMNFADKFPDIAMHITMGAIKNGESSGKQISVFEFAKAFKDIIENKEFDYQEVTNEWGETETLVTADPQVHEYEYNGETHTWRDFGFQKRFMYDHDILDVAYEYLSNAVYSYIDIPRFTSVILDNNREFTAELKNRGYDGTIQSDHGDEAVAFYPNQIKSAEPITRDADGNVIPLSKRFDSEQDDIRYSISKDGKNTSGDWHINGREFGDHDSFEDFAPVREDATAEPKTQLSVENATADRTEAVGDDFAPTEEAPAKEIPEEEEIPVKPTKEKLNERLTSRKTELDNITRLRDEANQSYDEQIAKAQAQLDAKKNKDTKVANSLKMRIERLQRLKADIDAKYAKRIKDISKGIDKVSEELEKDHTEKDRYAKAKVRIERDLNLEKATLTAEYAQRKADLQNRVADRETYISNKARELYEELRNLRKGVRASVDLGSLLDGGYDWGNLKSALSNVRYNPSGRVNINSAEESAVRQLIEESYESDVYSVDDLDLELAEKIQELDKKADEKKETARRATQRHKKSEEHTKFWSDLIGDTSTWVDMKTGLSYKTKTLRRILRKVVRDGRGNPDIRLADDIYDALETKYDHNEALLKRESAKLKESFQRLNLNHAEDQYAQMLGELRHNPETTLSEDVVKEFLKKHKGKINEEKVNKAIEESRKLYDDLIVRVNSVLKEQGFKEIPYRKGYFPHFTNPKQNWLQKALNWKVIDNEIPTSIAGLTEMFKPSRSWQSFNKQRMGDKTDYSLYQGLDSYIHGALDWIYHIEDLQERRSLENYIRYTHSEEGVKKRIEEIQNGDYDADEAQNLINGILDEANNPLSGLVRELMNRTNTLANKKSSMDRAVEDLTSRKIYSVMTNLNNRITANQVVGSVSSALTNFIPMVQSWHQVSPVYTVKGMGDYIRSVIVDDGMVQKSDFLTNRLMEEEKLFQTGWDKVTDKAGIMMEVVDGITSQTVWRSKYLQNLHEGMSENAAIKDADQFAKNLMAGRSRGNAPTIFDAKNPLVKMFTAFQLEVANQYGYMFDDVVKDSKSKLRLVKGYATAFLGAHLYNSLYSTLVGRDAAFDPISIIEDLMSGLFDDEEEKDDVLMDFGKDVLEEVPFVGGLLGGGRIPISSAFPYSGYSNPVESMLSDVSEGKLSTEWLKPLYYLAMPVGGGQIKKTVEGLGMFDDDRFITGSYTASGNLRFPVEDTFGNRVQAALFGQYASENARDYFDNERKALNRKQIAEFMQLDIPIRDYWEYRDGLKGLEKTSEYADYIDSLDLPIDKKNLLINNLVDRKTPIDMTDYDQYADFEEFDWATKNPEKYDFFTSIGVSYKDYKDADEETKDDYNWAYQYPHYYTLSKVITNDLLEYRGYYKTMTGLKADKDVNGNSISGTKKRKVIDYINSLDIDYGAKLVLLKSQYESVDEYNGEIFEYINNRDDLTFSEKLSILKTLGYTVQDDGYVTWD